MNTNLRRYWVRFELDQVKDFSYLKLGCGVTAYSEMDVCRLLKKYIFKEEDIPQIIEIIKDIDIRTLDQGHVVPNMGVCSIRGVWYPIGFRY